MHGREENNYIILKLDDGEDLFGCLIKPSYTGYCNNRKAYMKSSIIASLLSLFITRRSSSSISDLPL